MKYALVNSPSLKALKKKDITDKTRCSPPNPLPVSDCLLLPPAKESFRNKSPPNWGKTGNTLPAF
uniref:Uncharacterized protein n=1 Tax=Anguilla anguilla TaxID=7936 RepID=A0A0E9WUX5_ANGAN